MKYILTTSIAAIAVLQPFSQNAQAYELHEWGTFTSVSGSDGILLGGLQIEEERLPTFVYALDGMQNTGPGFSKGFRSQRPLRNVTIKMETPVIYFYSDKPFHAHVEVGFNGGAISQWYPQRSGGESVPKATKPIGLDPGKIAPDSKITSARAGRSVTLIGALVNSLLILVKFLAGILGQSQALIADAVHSISDLFTDAVVLFGLKIGQKAPDEEHQFGHARIETLASAIVGLALIATALYLGIDASLNIYNHTEYHPTGLALIGAGISIAFKEGLYHYTVRTGKRIKSQLIVANAWHHRSDAISSIPAGLAVAGTAPSWPGHVEAAEV